MTTVTNNKKVAPAHQATQEEGKAHHQYHQKEESLMCCSLTLMWTHEIQQHLKRHIPT